MPNHLRLDPSRTALLRRKFVAEMNRRFAAFRKAVRKLLVEENALGYVPKAGVPGLRGLRTLRNEGDTQTAHLRSDIRVENTRWAFETDAGKVEAFQGWMKTQTDAGILEVGGAGIKGKPWTYEYIRSAYTKGRTRSYTEKWMKEGRDDKVKGYEGTRQAFLEDSFNSPQAVSKIELLSTRTYTQLVGVTDAMSQQLSTILADGITAGNHPTVIAREMTKRIDGITRTRARTIARTEVIHAHAEGQLDGLEQQGEAKAKVMAEWSTAGDDRVCPLCEPLDGVVLTIKEARGLLPRHPNCRCAWMPADVGEGMKGQKRGDSVRKAILKSVKAEGPKRKPKSTAELLKRTNWGGADVRRKAKPPRAKPPTPKPLPPVKTPKGRLNTTVTADKAVAKESVEELGRVLEDVVDDLQNRFPVLGELLDAGESGVQMVLREPTTYGGGFVELVKGRGLISTGIYHKKSDLIHVSSGLAKKMKPRPEFGRFKIGNSLPDTARHELGHKLHLHLRDLTSAGQSNTGVEWYKLSSEFVGRGKHGVVSKYASTNQGELFAESFAAFTHPGYEKGSLPSPIEKFFTRILK